MEALNTIVELSHEFGVAEYVKAGGGNTSVKDETTLWVKPSGTTLGGITAETFVTLSRKKVDELYDIETPAESAAREELVKNVMAAAVENDAGRPSVEAPLHNLLTAQFVVHTHPALVNGLTCAKEGEAACRRLFPDALWVEYIDAGYTLCMSMQGRIERYRAKHGKEPSLILLQNHGIFVAADTAEGIRALYARVMNTLKAEYEKAGVSTGPETADRIPVQPGEGEIRALFGDDAAYIASCPRFAYAPGPITPDHLVYARAFPFVEDLTAAATDEYLAVRGYAPKIVVTGDRVYGVGTTQKNADLAIELALDGAQVLRLTAAFGGINYMTERAREFIENWEVESYRQSVAEK